MIGAFILCGLAALGGGVIDAIAGGGGLLTVPALLVAGVPPHVALGTNKVSACMGTTVALINFARGRLVLWRLAALGVGFSIIGSWLGALATLMIDSTALGKIIVFLLPLGMVGALLPQKNREKQIDPDKGPRFWLALPLVCLALGFYDGFFGPGTGSFLILALHWVLGISLLAASGTAKAFNLGSNVSGVVSFIWHGVVNWPIALLMAACFMAGNWLGSSLAMKIGAKAVRRILVLSLLILLLTLVWRYFLQ